MEAARLSTAARVLQGAVVSALGLGAVFLEAAPLGLGPLDNPSPDLLFCVLAVWVVRRPDSLPVALVFALGVMRDLLTDPPPGIGALSLVVAVELLRARRRALARQSFLAEWAVAGLALAGMLAMQWLALLLTFAQPPYLSLVLQQAILTLALYPAAALLLGRLRRRRWRDAAAP
jgi:rod shape-determining protein MreD